MEGQTVPDPDIVGDDIKVRSVRNFPFPVAPRFTKENIEAAMDYKAQDGDIILSSFPKTGTTWLQYIVWVILHKGESLPGCYDMSYRLVPYMEITGVECVDCLNQPRFYKTHLPYQLMSINEKAKYLYIYRDPKDTIVSYYHFYNSMRPNPVDFDTFFEAFVKGEIAYESYFDHVLSFYIHRNDKNILVLSYEQLQGDTRNQILKIAKFLGEDYYQTLKESEDLLAKVLEVTSFGYMKKHLSFKVSDLDEEHKGKLPKPGGPTINFFRKGVVGDGKSLMSSEQIQTLREKTLEKMTGTDLAHLWAL